MADPQLGRISTDGGLGLEVCLLEKAVAHANRLNPAFVVIAGDLIHLPGNDMQAEEFMRIVGKLDSHIPLYLVSGNHDLPDEPTPENLAWYRDRFGQDWYSFRHGGCLFVVINTTIIFGPAYAGAEVEEQSVWLADALRDSKADGSIHTIVLQHHPWFRYDYREEDSAYNLRLEERLQYLDLFKSHRVSAVFAGHFHRNGYNVYKNMPLVNTAAVCDPSGLDPAGFRIVKVFEDHIEHEFYGLDTMPERVSFV